MLTVTRLPATALPPSGHAPVPVMEQAVVSVTGPDARESRPQHPDQLRPGPPRTVPARPPVTLNPAECVTPLPPPAHVGDPPRRQGCPSGSASHPERPPLVACNYTQRKLSVVTADAGDTRTAPYRALPLFKWSGGGRFLSMKPHRVGTIVARRVGPQETPGVTSSENKFLVGSFPRTIRIAVPGQSAFFSA